MPIAINGSGTITGLSAGGLPDGSIITADLADDAVTATKLGTRTFVSYAVIADQKAGGTSSGSFTSGAWRTRDLNTELLDPDGIVTISSNQFTLQAGTYLIKWHAPAYKVDTHKSGLYDITGAAFIEYSMTMYANTSGNVQNVASGSFRVTIATANTYEIRHRGVTTSNTVGFGAGGSNGLGSGEIYTMVEIYKEA